MPRPVHASPGLAPGARRHGRHLRLSGHQASASQHAGQARRLADDLPRLVAPPANKQIQRDGDERETVAWDAYCRAQGGIGIGREAAIKLAMRAPNDLGRYGDAMQPRPSGVETLGASAQSADLRTWVVESVRHVWSIERPQVQARRFDWRIQIAETAQPASPRTRVNNCTHASPPECPINQGAPSYEHSKPCSRSALACTSAS